MNPACSSQMCQAKSRCWRRSVHLHALVHLVVRAVCVMSSKFVTGYFVGPVQCALFSYLPVERVIFRFALRVFAFASCKRNGPNRMLDHFPRWSGRIGKHRRVGSGVWNIDGLLVACFFHSVAASSDAFVDQETASRASEMAGACLCDIAHCCFLPYLWNNAWLRTHK